jgi:hypothetical protein
LLSPTDASWTCAAGVLGCSAGNWSWSSGGASGMRTFSGTCLTGLGLDVPDRRQAYRLQFWHNLVCAQARCKNFERTSSPRSRHRASSVC